MTRRMVSCLAAALVAVPVLSAELAGVSVPETLTVGGSRLVLNGLGLRKKAIFKVYVGALYLPQRSADSAAIIRLDAPKRMEMHFVRSVGKEKITDAWREGFANNSPSHLAELRQRLDNFCSLWRDIADGDTAAMTYVPGMGLKLEFNGKEVGLVQGKDFADAVLACWLGDKPPSADLKNGVLGK